MFPENEEIAGAGNNRLIGNLEKLFFDSELHINSIKRILKPQGTITAQVGSQDKKPKQVEKWLQLFEKNFANTSLDRIYIPSFDCSWNFASSINK